MTDIKKHGVNRAFDISHLCGDENFILKDNKALVFLSHLYGVGEP